MHIKILGTGCPNCENLEKNVRQVLTELKMEAEVEKVTDMERIIGYGIMSLPAIIIDEKMVSCGSVPKTEEIKKLLVSRKASSSENSKSCSCGKSCC